MTWTHSDTSLHPVRRNLNGGRSSWTKAEIRNARKQMLKPVLEHLGYHLQPREQENYFIPSMPGKVIIKDSYWINKEDGVAGNAIDFFVKLCGKSFSETMEILTARN